MCVRGGGVSGRRRICSLVALAPFWGLMLISRHTPEHRLDMAVYPQSVVLEYVLLLAILVVPHAAALVLVALGTFPDLQPALVIALALVVLGAFPDQEPALYLTAVAVGLYIGAISLFVGVFWRPPQTAGPPERAGP